MEDLLHLPLICSRQGITEDFPKWFGEKVDTLNIVATFNLAYNAGVLARGAWAMSSPSTSSFTPVLTVSCASGR